MSSVVKLCFCKLLWKTLCLCQQWFGIRSDLARALTYDMPTQNWALLSLMFTNVSFSLRFCMALKCIEQFQLDCKVWNELATEQIGFGNHAASLSELSRLRVKAVLWFIRNWHAVEGLCA